METRYGYCQCGCGEKTETYTYSSKRTGQVKGEPKRFINGHYQRTTRKGYIVTETGCWEYQGYIYPKTGYGVCARVVDGVKETLQVHRYYYELHKGPIPEGLELDHLCRNRKCVNPDHLEPVTRVVNRRRSSGTKLVASDVLQIRKWLQTEEVTRKEICKHYGITNSQITHIKNRKLWSDL